MLTEDELRCLATQAEAWLLDGDPFDGDQWAAMQVIRAWLGRDRGTVAEAAGVVAGAKPDTRGT